MSEKLNVAEHLAGMSDAELVAGANTATDDMAKAATDEPNSEWHEACFAAVVCFAFEMQTRGIKAATIH